MSVSVVIPAYNEADDIAQCLQALNSQTIKPLEVIVVDNNSTDNTARLATELGARVITEKRQGIGYARSAGFNQARGEIIARTDADTIVAPTWIESIQRALDEHPEVVAVSGRSAVYELSPTGKFWFGIIHRCFRLIHQLRLGRITMLYGHNMAIRRTTWQAIAQTAAKSDDSANEDVELSFLVKDQGPVIIAPAMRAKFRLIGSLQPRKLIRYISADSRKIRSLRGDK